jgi:hypothetical protein
MTTARAPLFRDPIHDGAADPTIIWNREEQSWWILYTNRRANVDGRGVGWVHGTEIGIASSSDGGQSWLYRGVLSGLEFERGRNTFWAPEVLWAEGVYHMYVSYVRGVPYDWSGDRRIVHMTSNNLWDWRLEEVLTLSSNRVIDACVARLPNGLWRMWYKDEANESHTYAADSPDLYHWTVVGSVITDCAHEGPNVFGLQGAWWMITDHWHGLGVYRSDDGERWVRQGDILDRPGQRRDDRALGHHADVLVQGERAYIFYFTHPEEHRTADRPRPGFEDMVPYAARRTSLQAAQLVVRDGRLTCDRDEAFDFALLKG